MYQFSYASQWVDMASPLGDYHSSELYFVWGNPWPLRRGPILHAFDDNDLAMSATFGAYWSAMAAAKDPNAETAGLPAWPAVSVPAGGSLDGLAHLQLQLPPEARSGLEDDACDFWDAYLGFA
jgi:carboxylesterase type B